ncbi:MAG: hypothetical protein QM485_12230 [Flavobacteriaceae bacterium]
MKNIIIALSLTFVGMGSYAQQGFKIGIQGGIPVGDFNNKVGVVIGVDAGYMYALGEVIDLGVTTGFIHGFPEKFQTGTVLADLPNVQFVPIAGSIRLWPSNSFSLGVDVGQAFGINDGNKGGLYYRPLIGFLLGPQTELNLSYTGINLEGDSWSTANIGILYTFEASRGRR